MDWRELRKLQGEAVQQGLKDLAAINAREKAQLEAELTANQKFESEQSLLQAERFKGYADRPTTCDACKGEGRFHRSSAHAEVGIGIECDACNGTGTTPLGPTTEEFANTLRVLVRSAEYELSADNHAGVADLLTTIRLRLEEFAQPTTAEKSEMPFGIVQWFENAGVWKLIAAFADEEQSVDTMFALHRANPGLTYKTVNRRR